MRLPKTHITELGTERQCTKCKEYWPEDHEFFYTAKRKNLETLQIQQPCKACFSELKRNQRKARKSEQLTPLYGVTQWAN